MVTNKKSPLFAALFSVVALAGFGGLSTAVAAPVVLFDSNGFEAPSYALGALDGQNGWDLFPAASGGRFQVVPNGATQVVQVNGGSINGVTNAFLFPDLSYNALANQNQEVLIEVDIARNVGATAATSSAGFYVDVFGTPTGNRTFRFGLGFNSTSLLPTIQVVAPFNTTTGLFQVGAPIFNVNLTGGIPNSILSFFSFRATANYVTKTFNLNVNGTDFGSIPFADPNATGIFDADLNVSSAAGRTDAGFFDNYRVTAIPEPTALGLLVPAGMLLARRRRA